MTIIVFTLANSQKEDTSGQDLQHRGIQPTDPLDPEAALEGSSHPSMTRREPGSLNTGP